MRTHAKECVILLRKTREYIASGQEYFICHAIDKAKGTESNCLVHDLKDWIKSMLGSWATLEDWYLSSKGLCPSIPGLCDACEEELLNFDSKKSRLLWIDNMIAHLDEE